jgi:hypothetical protein
MGNKDKRTFFARYWWLFAGVLSAVALSSALNITNTDGWIVVTNSSNDSWNVNWNTTRPTTCASGNYSYWTGTGFSCRDDQSGGGGIVPNTYDNVTALQSSNTTIFNQLGAIKTVDATQNTSISSAFTNLASLVTNASYTAGIGLNRSSQTLLVDATVCGAGQYSQFDGDKFLCVTDQTGGGGSGFRPEATNYYYKSYDFESITAVYGTPWAPAAIGAGTTALIAGAYNRPGLATVSSSTTASSGYSYQITGATTYLLGNGSGSIVMIAPIPKTGNFTTCKLGFQDVFTAALPVDSAYWNATQNNAGTFNWTPVMRTNNVEVRGSIQNYAANANQYFKAEVYVINNTQIQYTLYNSSGNGAVLNTQLLNGTVPSVAGRETSHAAVCFVQGVTTAQVLARLDYLGVYNNATVFTR